MKKLFTSLCCFAAAMGLNAQSTFVLSPVEYDDAMLNLYASALSENQTYVVGQDQTSTCPIIWNTVTGDVVMLSESELLVDEDGNPYKQNWEGYFHAVNSDGLAVGNYGAPSSVSHAILCDFNDPEDYIVLYEEDEDAGSSAYGISEDGSTVIGFHFDENWTTHGCVWTENGTKRTDLPWPTEEECGFAIDYASARALSADGSVIMGYVQDYNYGNWVFVCWERQEDGTYAVNASAAKKYFEYDYQLGKPYMLFEPNGLSKNGEWVTLNVMDEYDPWDWDYTPVNKAARLNIKTNEIEVFGETECSVFGIGNDGTAVGRVMDDLGLNHGIVWYAGEQEIKSVEEILSEHENMANALTSNLSDITGEGNCVAGTVLNGFLDGDDVTYLQYAFIAEIPAAQGGTTTINQVNNIVDNVAYDMMGRRVLNTKGHITIVNGQKNIAR